MKEERLDRENKELREFLMENGKKIQYEFVANVQGLAMTSGHID